MPRLRLPRPIRRTAVSMFLLAVAFAAAAPTPRGPDVAAAPSGLIALVGGRVLTVAGPEIPNGIVLIRDGRIDAVGADVPIPSGTEIIDVSGAVVTPGLIDAHSHLGLGASGGITEDNEMTDPVTPQLRIIDSIHPEGLPPDKDQFRNAVREGVTAVIARPGSGNVIGGQSAVLKLRGGTVDDMTVLFPADMKMALGRKPAYAAKDRMPMTKMAAAYLVRKAMVEAADYRAALARHAASAKPEAAPPARDLAREAMLLVLERRIPVHVHVHTSDDIMTAVRLAREFDFKDLSLGHAVEAYKVAGELAAAGVRVVVGPQMITSDEDAGGRPVNLAAELAAAGVEVSIMTDADVVQQSFLRIQAAVAVKHGMDPAAALAAITMNAARTVGLEGRLGAIAPGRDADLAVFSGDPFDPASRVLRVYIDGVCVHRAE